MKATLLGKLTGAAASWAQGKKAELAAMSLADLRQGLSEHFEGESLGNVRTLQRLKQGATPLNEFNKKFTTTAASALAQMSTLQVKDVYLQSLSNINTRRAVAACMHMPLQQVMQRAVDINFALDFEQPQRSNFTSTTTANNSQSNRYQDPNRKQCHKCKFWFDTSKGIPCMCPQYKNQSRNGPPNKPWG